VFSWSYQKLGQASARMFRLLGIHPGPSISTPAAASLAGVPVWQAGQALGQLVRAHLVSEPVPGRFGCHDLLRAYAAELAYAVDGAPARRAAVHRVLDHYLYTAHAVDCLLDPAREHASLGAPEPGTSLQHPAGRADAIAWLEAEKPALLAAVTYAAAHGFDSHAWQIPWTLGEFFDRRGYWADWAAIQQTALAAARRQGHLAGQAHASRDIGRALARLGRYDEAHPHLQAALDLRAQLGDPAGQAAAHVALGTLSLRQNRHLEALDHAQRAHDLYTTAGNRAGQANALGNMGWCYTLAGDYDRAIDCCRQAVELHRGLNDRFGEAHNWDSLGYAYYHRGDHAEALRYYQRSVDLFRELADRHHEADILGHIGDAQTAIGNPQAARDAWQRALAICDDLGSANAEEIRAKLGRAPPGRITPP